MIEWKVINGYPNYAISNDGQVKSIKFERFLKGAKNSSGYLYVNLVENKMAKSFAIHRLVMEHFGIIAPENNIVDHIDHDKLNNHIDNLQWLSIQENTTKYYNNYDKKLEVIRLHNEGKSVKEIVGLVDLGDYTIRKTIRQNFRI
jgi:hypothetical protein